MKSIIALFSLCGAGLLATACATGPKPVLADPQASFDTMRESWEKDDVDLFLHTVSRAVKKEFSEHTIRVGWSDIRPLVGDFVKPARIVKVEDYTAAPRDPSVSREFVWPDPDVPLKRVRILVDGVEEDILFQREVDPTPPQSNQARGFYIGGDWQTVTAHRSPETYLTNDSPESERTHWRLVFPYFPFQSQGALTRKLQNEFANEGG
jgi:hypothetical protein